MFTIPSPKENPMAITQKTRDAQSARKALVLGALQRLANPLGQVKASDRAVAREAGTSDRAVGAAYVDLVADGSIILQRGTNVKRVLAPGIVAYPEPSVITLTSVPAVVQIAEEIIETACAQWVHTMSPLTVPSAPPLVRWEPPKPYKVNLTAEEIAKLSDASGGCSTPSTETYEQKLEREYAAVGPEVNGFMQVAKRQYYEAKARRESVA
jgi:hypothetical protein